MERTEVYKLIDGERAYQAQKWNEETTETGGKHSPEEWLVYMQDYLNEALHVCSRNPAPQYKKEAMAIIRKITAMGVCAMEQIDTPAREGY